MKRRLFTGVSGISAAVTAENLIDVFEFMITDELLIIFVEILTYALIKFSWKNIQKIITHHKIFGE